VRQPRLFWRSRLTLIVAFVILLLFASSLGLLPHSALPQTPDAAKPFIPPQSDKAFHFICFFTLTATFYFILDAARRRVLHITLFVCTLLLGVGSEVAQELLPNDRDFDPWDVLANVLGSLCAVGLAGWYHRRAAERRRIAKYSALAGEDVGEGDLELGEGPGLSGTTDELRRTPQGQETGVAAVPPLKTVEEELDNWDENVPDDAWDRDDDDTTGKDLKMTPATSTSGSEETPPKKVAVD
jgi:VanZ family protein